MAWEYLNEAFPAGGIDIDGIWNSNQQLQQSNSSCISYVTERTIRGTTQWIKRLVYTPDGSFTIDKEYDIFPSVLIDQMPLLNAYAQLAYNTFARDNNCYSDYSLGSDPRERYMCNCKDIGEING